MLKLFQIEDCPFCKKVRKALADRNLSFETIFVPRLGSERRRFKSFPELEKPEVPVLKDNDIIIQDSDKILEYIEENYPLNFYGDPSYGLTRVIKGLSFSDAMGATKEALSSEGFGVLTEIDVKATLKKKINEDFRNYVILGACNPTLAHQALQHEPAMGLLLPCNVVLTEDNQGNAIVSAINPYKMFQVIDNPEMGSIAMEVKNKLAMALGKIRA